MNVFLGIDVGSSKTHAMLVDENGRCLGFGISGSGNHQGVGYDGLTLALNQSFNGATHMAGLQAIDIAGAGFGVAGYDWPSEYQAHLDCIATLGLRCPVEVVNDAVNGLIAGVSHGWGVNVSAGSGVNARGRGRDGREARIVGNGSRFGEEGGGIEIVLRGLQIVNHAWIKRRPPTALTQIYLKSTGAKDEMDLMEGISNDIYYLQSSLAIEIFRAAYNGDEAARELISWAGEELGWLAVACIRQLGVENDEVEVVQSGSIFKGGPLICEPMRDLVLRYAPRAQVTRLDAPPVVGSVLLGMEMAGVDGYTLKETLIREAKAMVEK